MRQQHRNLRYFETLRRAKAGRVLAVTVATLLPAACSSNDAEVFDTTTIASVATTAPDVTVPVSAQPATSTQVEVSFTYAMAGGGKPENPYIAVWVEDASGNLVQTVALWYQQDQKGMRWLNDLSSWNSTSGGAFTTSGATRAPGSYSLVWDGKDLNGNAVAAGNYVLYVESAREKGPHSLSTATVSVGSGATTVTLPDATELSQVIAKVQA